MAASIPGNDKELAAWARSIVEVVREDVEARMDGKHRKAIERVITKVYLDNDRAPKEICHKFWIKFGHFQHKTGKFANKGRWPLPLVQCYTTQYLAKWRAGPA